MNQFKLSEDALYERSDIKLIYMGHNMYVELKHICQPWPLLPHLSPQVINRQKRSLKQEREAVKLQIVVTDQNRNRTKNHQYLQHYVHHYDHQGKAAAKSTTSNLMMDWMSQKLSLPKQKGQNPIHPHPEEDLLPQDRQQISIL